MGGLTRATGCAGEGGQSKRGRHCCQPPLTVPRRSQLPVDFAWLCQRCLWPKPQATGRRTSAPAEVVPGPVRWVADPRMACIKQVCRPVPIPPGGSVTAFWCLAPVCCWTRRTCFSPSPRSSRKRSNVSVPLLHLRFARFVPGGTLEACFPILLRASLPYPPVAFSVPFQRLPSVPSLQKHPSDDLKLRLETESHKRDSGELSTGGRLHGG